VLQDNGASGERAVHTLGDDILGIRLANSAQCQQLAEHLRQAGSWLDAVAGIDSVAVRFDAASMSLDAARSRLGEQLLSVGSTPTSEPVLVDIPVCYGNAFGPDFDAVRESLGVSADELVALHTSCEHRVAMLGFTPGFAYVGGLPDKLNVPRRAEPRQRVAAGSVGIADGQTGLYAMAGPGGWSLIGRTPLQLFDARADAPFLLRAGMRIRFRQIDAETFHAMERS